MSKYVEVYVIVEGKTEQTFIREILAPYLSHKGVYLYSAQVGKPGQKGGDVRFDRAKNDIRNFLKQRSDTYVSTMFDYFRIGDDWPGKEIVQEARKTGVSIAASDKAKQLEESTRQKIIELYSDCNACNRFIPYIEMHEYEALLFSDINILAENIGVEATRINDMVSSFSNPEEINDSPENAPSKRLERLDRTYRKVTMGKIIAEAIGIEVIRGKCPHFNEWLTKLESLK